MRRILLVMTLGALVVGLAAGPAGACGGLVGRNGAVNLVRTTTLAAYHDGVEHYVTAFKFAGTGGEFGSIIPLPGVPSEVERGGDWTLQRLVREVRPVTDAVAQGATSRANSAAEASAEVILEKRIDALDLTVLRGGAAEVGVWAAEHGFLLPPDAPEVLEFYASRSPIFLAARFDADAARQRGLALGDGTPIRLAIPTDNPWVPLRILSLGRQPAERIQADVFLLTGSRPTLLPGDDAPGLRLERQQRASSLLLSDLRSDKGMGWVPESSWLTYLQVNATPGQLTYDLAVDATGGGQPSRAAAGLDLPPIAFRPPAGSVGSIGNTGNAEPPPAGNPGTSWPAAVALAAGVVVVVGGAGVAALARVGRRS